MNPQLDIFAEAQSLKLVNEKKLIVNIPIKTCLDYPFYYRCKSIFDYKDYLEAVNLKISLGDENFVSLELDDSHRIEYQSYKKYNGDVMITSIDVIDGDDQIILKVRKNGNSGGLRTVIDSELLQ